MVSIWDFLNDWKDEGYGIALISPDDIVLDPYIDGSDYPDMMLDRSCNGASVVSDEHKGCCIIFHSGQLEGKIGKDWTSDNISHFVA